MEEFTNGVAEKRFLNEQSWNGTLFYDPSIGLELFRVEDWLEENPPTLHINETESKSIVVLHPSINVSEYTKANHRDGISVPADVKDKIISGRNEMDHDSLLTMAKDCNSLKGFWFLSCKNKPQDLEKLWDSYFSKIAGRMYTKALKHEEGYEFTKIEARWNAKRNMGIVMISNNNFSNEEVINRLGSNINSHIFTLDVIYGHVSRSLSYKPQFYLDSGFDPHFEHDDNKNIYSKALNESQECEIVFSDGVRRWLDNHNQVQKQSWNGTLFYDPSQGLEFFKVQDWLGQNPPTLHINETESKSIVVLHPSINVSEYMKANHRDGISVPADVRNKITSRRNEMDHDSLLTMANDCNSLEGFWFLSCKNKPQDLEKLWDSYFSKIAGRMYTKALKHEEGYEFTKIEARWNAKRNMGIVMISNDNFSNEEVINKLGSNINSQICTLDVIYGHVSRCLSYKPQFYFDSGFDPHFGHEVNENIYSKALNESQECEIAFSDGVRRWLDNHNQVQST